MGKYLDNVVVGRYRYLRFEPYPGFAYEGIQTGDHASHYATLMSHPYHIGRPIGRLEPPYEGSDQTFAGQRLDGQTIASGIFDHCTFVNISFKDAHVEASRFLNCVFIGCYFRRARLSHCTIVGCSYHDCQFPKLVVDACTFNYTRFRRCQVGFSIMKATLPKEPNLRSDICRNLALESSRLGLRDEAKLYRMEEMAAHEEHLCNAVRGESSWYTNHYPGFARGKALGNLVLSRANRYLFGYGESMRVLFRNSLIAAVGVFPLLYWAFRSGLTYQIGDSPSFVDCVFFSIGTFLPVATMSSMASTTWYTHLIAAVEAAGGVVMLAFIAAYVFRWSLRR